MQKPPCLHGPRFQQRWQLMIGFPTRMPHGQSCLRTSIGTGPAAEKEYLRAIQLNPNNATARHWYALYLAELGRFDEALAEIDVARKT